MRVCTLQCQTTSTIEVLTPLSQQQKQPTPPSTQQRSNLSDQNVSGTQYGFDYVVRR